MSVDDVLAARFEEQRDRLTAVADRLLGSRAEAEDAVLAGQELAAGRSVFLGLLAGVALAAGEPAAAVAACQAGLAVAERGERFWVPELLRLQAAAGPGAAAAGDGGRQERVQWGPATWAP